MTPEMVQYLLYVGLVFGGFLLRHFGIPAPLLPGGGPLTPKPSPPSPTAGNDGPSATNGNLTPSPSKSFVDLLDTRLAALEMRLQTRLDSAEPRLAADLVKLAGRLIRERETPSGTA